MTSYSGVQATGNLPAYAADVLASFVHVYKLLSLFLSNLQVYRTRMPHSLVTHTATGRASSGEDTDKLWFCLPYELITGYNCHMNLFQCHDCTSACMYTILVT